MWDSAGERLAACNGKVVKILNAGTGAEEQKFDFESESPVHNASMMFDPAGERLMIGWGKFVRVINVGTGITEQQFDFPDARCSASFDPTGQRLVGYGYDPGSMYVFRMGTFELEHELAPIGYQYSPGWHPSGERLAVCGEKCKVELFNMTTGEKEQEYSFKERQHPGGISAAWDPTGQRIAVGAWGKTHHDRSGNVAIFHVATGAPSQEFGLRAFCSGVAWDPTGEQLAAADRGHDGGVAEVLVYIFNVAKDAVEHTFECGHSKQLGHVSCLGWHPTGERLVVCSSGSANPVVFVFNAATGVMEQKFNVATGGELRVAWDPAGQRLATFHGSFLKEGTVRILDGTTFAEQLSIKLFG